MSISRIRYEDLPLAVRCAVEEATGAYEVAKPVADGLNSAVAVKLVCPKGTFFIKALPSDHRWAWTQAREAEVAPYVGEVAPALHARIVEEGWDVLVFEGLKGHQANYAPGSPDLPLVADLLTLIGQIECPGIPLRRAEQRLGSYVDAKDLKFFEGDALLHTDLNNANVLVSDDGARIVDWGWATRGAPWLDAGYWVLWLIAAGHAPRSAEQWAAHVPSWRTAESEGITAFAEATELIWREIGGSNPDGWTRRLMEASKTWREFRSAAKGNGRL
ncbi:phosphotransferase family protein [Actinoplanes flavus]|uniref:Phosphotransferase n=1 Tax=Actinoplanes flavus TaxID=2820290 RepID=A0ABS3UNI8_9ACTN|nr:phosphotransferase [Actinoplanes flavus]MBO3740337.1 phosphotransferase [Actinoplanes flavus]